MKGFELRDEKPGWMNEWMSLCVDTFLVWLWNFMNEWEAVVNYVVKSLDEWMDGVVKLDEEPVLIGMVNEWMNEWAFVLTYFLT